MKSSTTTYVIEGMPDSENPGGRTPGGGPGYIPGPDYLEFVDLRRYFRKLTNTTTNVKSTNTRRTKLNSLKHDLEKSVEFGSDLTKQPHRKHGS